MTDETPTQRARRRTEEWRQAALREIRNALARWIPTLPPEIVQAVETYVGHLRTPYEQEIAILERKVFREIERAQQLEALNDLQLGTINGMRLEAQKLREDLEKVKRASQRPTIVPPLKRKVPPPLPPRLPARDPTLPTSFFPGSDSEPPPSVGEDQIITREYETPPEIELPQLGPDDDTPVRPREPTPRDRLPTRNLRPPKA